MEKAWHAEHPGMRILDVAAATGLGGAMARCCLLTLHGLGHADDKGKFFTLTAKVLRSGIGALPATSSAQMVHPCPDRLSDRIRQSTCVSILGGAEIVYLAGAAQRRDMISALHMR